MKISLLIEIRPFYNSVNTYSSNSGYTVENWSSEIPDHVHFLGQSFITKKL